VDELTREVNPQIADPVQRALLRADRLFATGQIVTALQTLEHAATVYPDRKEIVSAQRRLNGEFSVGITNDSQSWRLKNRAIRKFRPL
jgi:hypothetical protein